MRRSSSVRVWAGFVGGVLLRFLVYMEGRYGVGVDRVG